jgi:hypothetical protein
MKLFQKSRDNRNVDSPRLTSETFNPSVKAVIAGSTPLLAGSQRHSWGPALQCAANLAPLIRTRPAP